MHPMSDPSRGGFESPLQPAVTSFLSPGSCRGTLTRLLASEPTEGPRKDIGLGVPRDTLRPNRGRALVRELYSNLEPHRIARLADSDDESSSPAAAAASPPRRTQSNTPAWFKCSEEGVELQSPPRGLAPITRLIDAELIRRHRSLRAGGGVIALSGRSIGDASLVHWARRVSALLAAGSLAPPLTLDLTDNELGPGGLGALLDALPPPEAASALLGGLVVSANPALVGTARAVGATFDAFAGAVGVGPGAELPLPWARETDASFTTGGLRRASRALDAESESEAVVPASGLGGGGEPPLLPPPPPPPWAPLEAGLGAWLPRLLQHASAPGSRLVCLELDGLRGLGRGGVGALCRALGASPPPPLQALSLGDCGLSEGAGGGLDELCWLLAAPACRLVELALRWNALGAGAVAPLARALAANQSLHALDLSWNLLGGSGTSEQQPRAGTTSHGRGSAPSFSSSQPTAGGGGLGLLLHAIAGHPRLLHVALERCGIGRGDMATLVRLVSGRAPLLACLHLAEDGDACSHADLAAAILAPPSEAEAAEPADAAASAAARSLSLLLPPTASAAGGSQQGTWVPVRSALHVQSDALPPSVAVDMPSAKGGSGFAKAVSSLLAVSSSDGGRVSVSSSSGGGRVILSRLCGHLHLEGSERWRLAAACWLCDRWTERAFTYTAPEATPSAEAAAAVGGHTWVGGSGAFAASGPLASTAPPASSRQALGGHRVSALAPLAAAAASLAQSRAASLSILPVHQAPGHISAAAADSALLLDSDAAMVAAAAAAAERVFLATSLDGWLLHEMSGTSPLAMSAEEGEEEGDGGGLGTGRGYNSSRSMASVESDRDAWQAERGDVAGLLRSAGPPPLPLLHRRWAASVLLPPSSHHAGQQQQQTASLPPPALSPPCFFVFLRLSRSSARVVVDASQACASWGGRPLALDCSVLSASTAAELRGGSSSEGGPSARFIVLSRVPLVNVLTAAAASSASASAAAAGGGQGATHTATAGGGGHATADLFELALLASSRLVRRVRWRVEESVFAGLRPPAGGAAAQRAFDADYSRVRMDRITAAAAGTRGDATGGGGGWRSGVSLVGATLLAHWPLLCEVFKAAAALSAAPNLAYGATQGLSVSWKEFSRFAAGIGAVDPPESGGGGCRGSDIDTIFIVVNAGGGGAAAAASAASAAARGGAAEAAAAAMDDDVRSFCRYEFLESVVRIAQVKFLGLGGGGGSGGATGAATAPCALLSEAVNKLITEHVVPRAERLDSRAWRASRLVCADVDAVLRPAMGALQDLYHACASYRPPGVARGPLRLSIDDWFGLLGSGGLLDEASCGAREAALAFVWASDATAAEEGSGGELAITLSGAAELAQALAHVAEVRRRCAAGGGRHEASQSLLTAAPPPSLPDLLTLPQLKCRRLLTTMLSAGRGTGAAAAGGGPRVPAQALAAAGGGGSARVPPVLPPLRVARVGSRSDLPLALLSKRSSRGISAPVASSARGPEQQQKQMLGRSPSGRPLLLLPLAAPATPGLTPAIAGSAGNGSALSPAPSLPPPLAGSETTPRPPYVKQAGQLLPPPALAPLLQPLWGAAIGALRASLASLLLDPPQDQQQQAATGDKIGASSGSGPPPPMRGSYALSADLATLVAALRACAPTPLCDEDAGLLAHGAARPPLLLPASVCVPLSVSLRIVLGAALQQLIQRQRQQQLPRMPPRRQPAAAAPI